MKRIVTKVKYLRGQMLRFIRRISLGRKVLPLYNAVLVHHGNYLPSFDHHIFFEEVEARDGFNFDRVAFDSFSWQ